MNDGTPRVSLPDFGIQLVNSAASNVNSIAYDPNGTPRDLTGAGAISLINAQATIALACALLALATKE